MEDEAVSEKEPPTKRVSPSRAKEVTGPLRPPCESEVRAPFLNIMILLEPEAEKVPPRKTVPDE